MTCWLPKDQVSLYVSYIKLKFHHSQNANIRSYQKPYKCSSALEVFNAIRIYFILTLLPYLLTKT